MKTLIACIALSATATGCASGGQGQEPDPETLVAGGVSAASFDPTGEMYVTTRGMHLAIGRLGDERTFLLTSSPPAEGGEAEAEAGETECVPAAPGAPLPGPQGGWHGHAAWSPDGRFIAFMAPWKDGNCVDGDDSDWDIWLVDVGGLDLDTWVREVTPDPEQPDRKDLYIVGKGPGLAYYQVTNAPGPDQRPTWVTCRTLAWSTDGGIVSRELSGIPGVCEKTLAEQAEEREAQIARLESQVASLMRKVAELSTRITSLEQPAGEPAE
jgi:hypothetical protein